MKRRSTWAKVGVLLSSLALFGGYVVARGMGWIGHAPPTHESADSGTPAPSNPATTAEPPQEFFAGSKSAQVLTGDQTRTLMPSSKVLVLDPLPTTTKPLGPDATQPAPPKSPTQVPPQTRSPSQSPPK